MRVIQLSPADAGRIVELERTALVSLSEGSVEEIVARFDRGHRMFGIEMQGQLCAVLCLYFDALGDGLPGRFPATFDELVARRSAEAFDSAVLYNLAVVPQLRDGRAVKRLLAAVLDHAKDNNCERAVASCRMPSYATLAASFRQGIEEALTAGRMPAEEDLLVDPTLALVHRLTRGRFACILPDFAPEDLASGGMRVLTCVELAAWRADTNGSSAGEAAMEVESLEPRILLSATWVDADMGGALDGATEGNDGFEGSSSHDVAHGLAGDDELWGNKGNDDLFGGEGDDSAWGGRGNDELFGEAGDDVLHGEDGNDDLSGGEGDDTLLGGDGNDDLQGGAGEDVLDGGAGNDEVYAGEGDDRILAAGDGADNDRIWGGEGVDTVDYSEADSAVVVDLTEGTATGGGGHDQLHEIESVVGSQHDDTFAFSSPEAGATYVVDGGGGSNVIDLSAFSAEEITLDAAQGTVTVDVDGGTATIDYENVDTLVLSDGELDTTTSDDATPDSDAHAEDADAEDEEDGAAGGLDEVDVSAGDDQSVDEGQLVTLQGAVDGPGGTDVQLTWVQTGGPTVVLSDPHAPEPTFSAPEGVSNSSITFELQVSDGTTTSIDTVDVTVHADDDAPTADAGLPQAVDEGDLVTLSGAGSDVEGQELSTTWVQTGGPTVILSDPHAAEPTFSAPEGVSNSTITFELQVSDGTTTSVDTVDVTVHADDDAPTADAGLPQAVDEGDLVTLSGAGADVEGQELTTTWVQTGGPTVVLSDPHAAEPTFSAPEGVSNSTITFELQVSDGTTTSVDTVDVTVHADDDAPTADAGLPQAVDEGDLVTLSGAGADVEGQELTTTWVQTGGPTVVLSDPHAAEPTFSAPEGVSNSTITFELQVSDGTTTSVDTVDVTVHADDDAPTADAGLPQAVDEGDLVTLSGAGSDVEGQELSTTWVQTGGPTVILSDPHAAEPTFSAPEGVSNSTITFELQVSDGTTTSVDTVDVTVHADDDAPTADAGLPQAVDEGDLVTLSGAGADVEGQELTTTWVQTGGPTVVLSDPHAAEPTFSAPEGVSNSTITFELQVSDGTTTSVDTVDVTVHADDDAPTADAGLPQAVDEGDLVTLSGAGADVEGQELTTTWVQTGGPTVVLSDPHAAEPTFSAPEGVSNSTITFELQVSDGTTTSVDTVDVIVHADDDAPVANAGLPHAVEEGEAVTLVGAGTDSEGQHLGYTWVQTGGPAVTLDDPHATEPSFEAPEGVSNTTITFELHVSDGTTTSVDTVDVTVNADDDAPVADAGFALRMAGGELVQLGGGGADQDSQGVAYTWVQVDGPPVELSDPHATDPTFTAPSGFDGTVQFELQVSDGTSTSVDTVQVQLVSQPEPEPTEPQPFAEPLPAPEAPAPAQSEGPPPVVLDPDEVVGTVDVMEQEVDADLLQQILPADAQAELDVDPAQAEPDGQDLSPLFSRVVDYGSPASTEDSDLHGLSETLTDQEFDDVFEEVAEVGQGPTPLEASAVDPGAASVVPTEGEGETATEASAGPRGGFLASLWAAVRGRVDGSEKTQPQNNDSPKNQGRRS